MPLPLLLEPKRILLETLEKSETVRLRALGSAIVQVLVVAIAFLSVSDGRRRQLYIASGQRRRKENRTTKRDAQARAPKRSVVGSRCSSDVECCKAEARSEVLCDAL